MAVSNKKVKLSFDKNQRILFKNATILTMDARIGNFSTGDLLITGTKIAAVAASLQVEDAVVMDASDMIIMPGLVDAHRHAWQGSLRRLMPNVDNLGEYVDAIHFTLAKYYRPQDIHIGNLLTALSCIDSGITTLVDASHNTRSLAHAHAAIDALEQAGIRALYAPGKPLAGDWDQHSWPSDLEKLRAGRFSSADRLVNLGLFSQPDPENWALARRLNLRIITEFLGPQLSAVLPGLQQQGLLGPDNIFNHCTGLTEEAWQIIKATGINVTVDPRSDAQYALEEGVFAYQHAIDMGIKPGIGTDLETAYGGDLFTEMRVAFSLQRAFAQHLRYKGDEGAPRPVSVQEILEAATLHGAAIAGVGDTTGSLTPGKEADIVLIRTNDLNLFPSGNAVGTVVHAADRSNVDTVVVGGRILKSGGQLHADIGGLKKMAEESLSYLFAKGGYKQNILEESFPALTGDKPAAWTGV